MMGPLGIGNGAAGHAAASCQHGRARASPLDQAGRMTGRAGGEKEMILAFDRGGAWR